MHGKVIWIALLLVSGVCAAPLYGQQPSSGVTPANEFHVDEQCHIYETVSGPKGLEEHIYRDRGICAVESPQTSFRTETEIVGDQRVRTHVTIRERSFTLHNPTSQSVTFVLNQTVPKGWQVDSDPQPNQFAPLTSKNKKATGTMATFLISAEPKQTVNLHVGERKPAVQP